MGLKTTLKSLIIKYNYIGWRVVQIRKKIKHLSSKNPLVINKGGVYRIIKKGRGSNNRVIIEDGVCKLADHSALAGSIATMDRLIRTMVQKADIPLADAIRMASETPARLIGIDDRKGTLARGKDADILILDRKLKVRGVWSMGHEIGGTNTLA